MYLLEVIILLVLLQVSQPPHSFVMEVLDRVAVLVDVIRLLLVFWYGSVDDTCHIFFSSVLR